MYFIKFSNESVITVEDDEIEDIIECVDGLTRDVVSITDTRGHEYVDAIMAIVEDR